MTQAARSIPGMLAGALALVLGGAPALESAAGEAHKGYQSVGRYKGAHSTVSRPGPSDGLRRLLPPAGLGSAANVPPGFYQRLSAPRHHASPRHGHPHHPLPIYVPYPVYVEPLAYAAPPETTLQYAAAPAPQPPPQIYVVQAPPAPAAMEPVRTPAPPALPAAAPEPRSLEPVPVRFSIAPAEASVYLDDELLGTAAELGGQELMLPPGVYVLEVVGAGGELQRLVFGVGSEAPLEVAVDLGAERRGRRTRIR